MSKPARKRVTLADVAAKAGVSVATASVAITGRPSGNCRVSVEVAEKIRAAARSLNYRPNIQARNLSTQRTHTVAMLIKRAAWHNAMFYVSSAQRVLRDRGYIENFMLHPDNSAESERRHLELCLERGVEGIMAIPLIDPQGHANVELYNRLHKEDGVPVVQIGTAVPGCVAPSVTVDVVTSVSGAIARLHAMGHRHIGLVTVPGYDSAEALSPHRFAHLVYLGYRAGMADAGLKEQIFVATGERTEVVHQYDTAVPVAAEIARTKPRPTAVIGFSEYAAAGVMAGLAEHGLRVPDDISVIGGGEQPFARMLRPSLATLASPYEQMGEAATQMLLQMIEGDPSVPSLALPATLIQRESVRALK